MTNKDDWQRFIILCEIAAKKDKLSELFEFIFTPEEREQLALRASLTKALLEGEISQRDISSHLKVSISKITRGSNALKTIDSKLKKFLTDNL